MRWDISWVAAPSVPLSGFKINFHKEEMQYDSQIFYILIKHNYVNHNYEAICKKDANIVVVLTILSLLDKISWNGIQESQPLKRPIIKVIPLM